MTNAMWLWEKRERERETYIFGGSIMRKAIAIVEELHGFVVEVSLLAISHQELFQHGATFDTEKHFNAILQIMWSNNKGEKQDI